MRCIARCCCAFPAPPTTSPTLLARAACWCGPSSRSRYDGYEIVPDGYTCREGLGRKLWTEDPPTWHVQAWPLRQPWIADQATGPDLQCQRQRPALLGALRRQRPGARSPCRACSSRRSCRRTARSALRHHAAARRPTLSSARRAPRAALARAKRLPAAQARDLRFALPRSRQCLRMGDADRRPRPALRGAAPGRHVAPRRQRARCRSPCRRTLDREWQLSTDDGSRPTACCCRRPK